MNRQRTYSTSWPLILIAIALAGAGMSYHLTLQARFAAMEQKLDQNSVALQQYEASQETLISSKTEALDKLSQQMEALQASLDALSKARAVSTAAPEVRKQKVALQASSASQPETKRSSDETVPVAPVHPVVIAPPVEVPIPPAPAPVSTHAPLSSSSAAVSVPSPRASVSPLPLPFPPHANSGSVDLRPFETTAADYAPVRIMPVAMSDSDVR